MRFSAMRALIQLEGDFANNPMKLAILAASEILFASNCIELNVTSVMMQGDWFVAKEHKKPLKFALLFGGIAQANISVCRRPE